MMNREQALDLYKSDDLIRIGMEADAVRRRLHPERIAGYSVDCRIDFIAPWDEAAGQVQQLINKGGTGVIFKNRRNGDQGIDTCEALLSSMKARFPVTCHFSSLEVLRLAQANALPVRDTITRLRDAGLSAIMDDDEPFSSADLNEAALLSEPKMLRDEAALLSEPKMLRGEAALLSEPKMLRDRTEVHLAAHRLGMKTTVAFSFDESEEWEHRLDILECLRRIQEEAGGFLAARPIPGNTVTAAEYLKTLALTRIYLDQIPTIQTSWNAGVKVCQLALRFGSNDFGTLPAEESVVTEEQLRRLIRDGGFTPKQRDTLFSAYFLQ